MRKPPSDVLILAAILLLALGLRLVVWRWHQFYPLGGDEREYFQQALTLLREWRYEELRLMRPPLYGVFLAGCIVLVDSLVQNLRLVQAFISTATVVPVWLLTREILLLPPMQRAGSEPPPHSTTLARAPHIAALLCGLSYTLAAHATELLTETLFLFGLTTLFWLLVRTQRTPSRGLLCGGAAGLLLGMLCLTRAVALVLLPMGALWLAVGSIAAGYGRRAVLPTLVFVVAAVLVVAPWSIRNYATYGALIIVDTTGAENLWLDNDPRGREAVKAQLYAMGDDRAARQQHAMQQGIAAIRAHPDHVLRKAWSELQAFFALEYTDDMRERPVIWVPPAEVGARLLLGDSLWLVVLFGGTAGLWHTLGTLWAAAGIPWWRRAAAPAVLLALWALYTLLTAVIFHVELRYRLPLYPALLPYAAMTLTRLSIRRWRNPPHPRITRTTPLRIVLHPLTWMVCLMLLHAPYPLLAWQLGWKHLHLARAEYALQHDNPAAAAAAAQAALHHDNTSVLAHTALAQAAIHQGEQATAEALLHEAIALQPAHPHPHLLLGDLLRQQGAVAAARAELQYETASLQDLQRWSWQRCTSPPPHALAPGNGLDLGFVQGFYPAEGGEHENAHAQPWRWSGATARVRLGLPPAPDTPGTSFILRLHLASGRPADAPMPYVTVAADGVVLGRFQVERGWRSYRLPLAACGASTEPARQREAAGGCIIELHSELFLPRSYQPESDDGRTLGVMVRLVAIEPASGGNTTPPVWHAPARHLE
jgi:hypothetical protein